MLITRNFPPLVGGMERLVQNLYLQLQQHYSIDLIGPKGCSDYCDDNGEVFETRTRPLFAFLFNSMTRALRLAIRRKPEVILSGSGLTAPAALLAGKAAGVPVITYLHGLDLVVNNRLYQNFFVPMLRRTDRVIVNSHNTARLAEAAGIASDRIDVIHPGVESVNGTLPESSFRSQFGLNNKKILLSVGRMIPRKGLAEFIRYSLPGIVSDHPDTVLVVIGDEAIDALKKDRPSQEQVRPAVEQAGMEQHIMLAGRVDDETLHAAYAEADLCIFPLVDIPGDVEGFGMVAIEAAARGLPTAAFSVGGVVDAIEDRKTGFLIEPGDYNALTDTCSRYLEGHYPDVTGTSCRDFAADFHWSRFGEKVRHSIDKVTHLENT
jgi:phosphatidylinositol alpha-1,6-mannosyltransferase